MNNSVRARVRLTTRNEGKIKSYESCIDLRAWSHDIERRDCYLRDWIKSDMPICVLPVCTLASILSIMTCRQRGKILPRCQPDCKSKIVLESICASCHAIKDCLKDSQEFNTYFLEEEFETCHWPCERCLEILKSIRMYWRIIIEKVLKINLPKSDDFDSAHGSASIRNVAKVWEKEMIQQAILVKSAALLIKQNQDLSSFEDICKSDENINSVIHFKNKGTETECEFKSVASQKDNKPMRKKMSKCTSVNIRTINASCQTCNVGEGSKSFIMHRNQIDNLQQQHFQKFEVDRLKKENVALKIELHHVRGNRSRNSLCYDPSTLNTVYDNAGLAPKPFESYSEEVLDLNPSKDIDSEMIITVKNCKHETFRHVSMLQVLHKTNGPIFKLRDSESCCNKEDPIQLLNKVHKTFGAIVNREISIANKTSSYKKNRDVKIKATFRKVGVSSSAPSCSTVTSCSATSHSNFESANDTSTKSGI